MQTPYVLSSNPGPSAECTFIAAPMILSVISSYNMSLTLRVLRVLRGGEFCGEFRGEFHRPPLRGGEFGCARGDFQANGAPHMIPLRWDSNTCDETAANILAAAIGIEPAVARLLCQRGISDPGLAERFLNPSLDHLHDPLLLADMRAAVDRILAAIGRLHAEGVALVVSVDCGIRGAEAARRARELGIDLIITDHHEPDAELPAALAVINPKRRDCSYPDKDLAGVGVALKLVQSLCRATERESWLPGFIKVAAIGTLADVVPLVGENRVIAKIGLDMLSRGPHKIGLRSLLDISGLTGKTIDSYHISFLLAPRVNAAGRMSTPDIATRL